MDLKLTRDQKASYPLPMNLLSKDFDPITKSLEAEIYTFNPVTATKKGSESVVL